MSARKSVTRIVGGAVLGVLLFAPRGAVAETLLLMMDSGPPQSNQLKAVRAQVAGQGLTIVVAGASLDDTALMLGCDPSEEACLDTVASTANADGLLVVPSGDGPLLVRRAKTNTEVPIGGGGRPDALQAAVATAFGDGEARATGEPGTTGEPDSETGPADPESLAEEPDGASTEANGETGASTEVEDSTMTSAPSLDGHAQSTGFTLDRVRRRTWIVLGTGAAATGLGLGLLSIASSKQDEVDGHPVDSAADLEALQTLENSGANFTTAGNLFVIAGAAAILGGAGLLVWDAKKERRETQAAIIPTATSTGFGVALRWTSK